MADTPAALLFAEAQRMIVRQEASVDLLRTKVTGVIGLDVAVAGFLGTRIVANNLNSLWGVVALSLFGLCSLSAHVSYSPRGCCLRLRPRERHRLGRALRPVRAMRARACCNLSSLVS